MVPIDIIIGSRWPYYRPRLAADISTLRAVKLPIRMGHALYRVRLAHLARTEYSDFEFRPTAIMVADMV